MNTAAATLVVVAGIGGSGRDHWQSRWHARLPTSVWVQHESWAEPERRAWVRDLAEALQRIDGPKVLVAHSLGCSLVTEWAAEHEDEAVVGALLVAVPDVTGPHFPAEAVGFRPPPRRALPFRTVVVASQDDPYGSPEHSRLVADRLSARLVDVGRCGHLNADAGLGDWPAGWAVLHRELLT